MSKAPGQITETTGVISGGIHRLKPRGGGGSGAAVRISAPACMTGNGDSGAVA
jgi:hypothetical protein